MKPYWFQNLVFSTLSKPFRAIYMQEDYPSREEERGLIKRFEEQLKQKTFSFFDVTEYETIVQYYLEHMQYGKAHKASKMALEQYPFSQGVLLLPKKSLRKLKRECLPV